MAPTLLSFNCAVITGGAGGIGRALAEWLISLDKKVILCGRTQSKLSQTASEIGKDKGVKVPYYVLDTGDVGSIPGFVRSVTMDHPEVDCVINNAGVQRPLHVDGAGEGEEGFDLGKADQEIDINIRGPLHLAISLLPHLRSKPNALIVNVSSVLGFIPFSTINPVYNATKAWLHFWSISLRTQLDGTNIKVVEIAPPMVETDLHRERENPDDNKKENNSSALSLEEFMKEVEAQWKDGKVMISAGMGRGIVDRWEKEFGEQYVKMVKG